MERLNGVNVEEGIKKLLEEINKKYNNRVKLHCEAHNRVKDLEPAEDELKDLKERILKLKESLVGWKTELHLPPDSMAILTGLFDLVDEDSIAFCKAKLRRLKSELNSFNIGHGNLYGYATVHLETAEAYIEDGNVMEAKGYLNISQDDIRKLRDLT